MYDYLRFYSGDRTSGTELGTFWDTSPGSMMTCYPVVTIVFYTDGTITARGFHLTYQEEAERKYNHLIGQIRDALWYSMIILTILVLIAQFQ